MKKEMSKLVITTLMMICASSNLYAFCTESGGAWTVTAANCPTFSEQAAGCTVTTCLTDTGDNFPGLCAPIIGSSVNCTDGGSDIYGDIQVQHQLCDLYGSGCGVTYATDDNYGYHTWYDTTACAH